MRARKSKRKTGLTPLGDLLDGVLGKNLNLTSNPLLQIAERWLEIVGPFIAKRMQPIRIENNRLICFVSSSSFLQEFSYIEADILKKLVQYSFARDIVGIRLTTVEEKRNADHNYLAESWKQREKHFQFSQDEPLTLIELEELRTAVAKISDPETQARSFRLLKAMAQRKKNLLKSEWLLCTQCRSYWEPGHQTCPFCKKILNKN